MSQDNLPPGGAGQPSQEELQAALARLREAPLTDVVLDIVQGLLSAAQVKVGRRDGRLLLDLVATVNDQIEGHVDGQLTEQVTQALTQLRMAQVEGEKQIQDSGEVEPNDLAGDAAQQAGAPGGEQAAPPASSESPPQRSGPDDPTSRLWIPGR